MKKIGPQLFKAFSKNGASLKNVVDFEEPDNEKKGISNMFHKVFETLSSCLCLNNQNSLV